MEDLRKQTEPSEENPNLKHSIFWDLHTTVHMAKNGKFRVKRKTSRKKFSHKCKEVHKLIGEMRTLPVKEIEKKLNQILVGNFYENIRTCGVRPYEIPIK